MAETATALDVVLVAARALVNVAREQPQPNTAELDLQRVERAIEILSGREAPPARSPSSLDFEQPIWDAYLTEHPLADEDPDHWPQWLIAASQAVEDVVSRASAPAPTGGREGRELWLARGATPYVRNTEMPRVEHVADENAAVLAADSRYEVIRVREVLSETDTPRPEATR